MRLRIPRSLGPVTAVQTRSNPDREPRWRDARLVWTADGWDWWEAPVTVENPVHGYRWLVVLAGGAQRWVNAAGFHDIEVPDADDFRFTGYPAPPAWLPGTVLYQVFPDRFARSSAADDRALPDWAIPAKWTDPVDPEPPGRSQQFYGGDLDGIVEHLDHLIGLGVTVLYLTPFFAARSNHRYDSVDFNRVDPLLGGDEALIRLVGAAHSHGIRVIGDLTTNHCGDGHEWFRAALGDPEAPESEFFYWLDDAHTQYVSWLGVPSLPKFNWASPELRRRFIDGPDSVVAHWLKPPFRLDGWRIDVSNMTGRYLADDFNTEVRRIIRRTMVEVNPDTMLLGESTNDAAPDFPGDAWHGAMTYGNFTRPLWGWLSRPGRVAKGGIGFAREQVPALTGRQFVAQHQAFTAAFPWRSRLATMNALDTHDTPRFGGGALPGAVPVALGLSVTVPGIPVVWAGDEFGLVGEDGETSRTPMPWSDLAGDTLAAYRAVLALRRAHPVLSDGGFRWVHVGDDAIAFIRESAAESVLVLATRAADRIRLPLGVVLGAEESRLLHGPAVLTAHPSIDEADGFLELDAPGISFTAWSLPGVQLPDPA